MVKIELKKISVNARMSEETHCFSADLYVDGVRWGEISNRGHGGSDDFHPVAGRNYGDLMDLDKRIAAEHPQIDMSDVGAPGQTMNASLETICGDLVNDFLFARDLKRLTGRKIVYFPHGVPAESETAPLYGFELKGRPVEVLASQIRSRTPSAAILNLMPEAEALAAFRRAN